MQPQPCWVPSHYPSAGQRNKCSEWLLESLVHWDMAVYMGRRQAPTHWAMCHWPVRGQQCGRSLLLLPSSRAARAGAGQQLLRAGQPRDTARPRDSQPPPTGSPQTQRISSTLASQPTAGGTAERAFLSRAACTMTAWMACCCQSLPCSVPYHLF